jgi:hypothetical protein
MSPPALEPVSVSPGWCCLFTVTASGSSPCIVEGEEGYGAIEVDGVPIWAVKFMTTSFWVADAFDADGSKGVILRINSPGGSPVQRRRFTRPRSRVASDKPVHAVERHLLREALHAALRTRYMRIHLAGRSIGVPDGFFTEP